jgi:hypothetical protein
MVKKYLIVMIGISLVLGCSTWHIVYRAAPFFLEFSALKTFDLESAQVKSWRPRLHAGLQSHRQHLLPQVAALLDSLILQAQRGFTDSTLRCTSLQIQQLYRQHAQLAINVITPLLLSLTPEQVHRLQYQWFEQWSQELMQRHPSDTPHVLERRAKRYKNNLTEVLGSLEPHQARIIEQLASAIPNSEQAWLCYRYTAQQALLRRLTTDVDAERLHAFLTTWLIEFSHAPIEVQSFVTTVHDEWINGLMALEPTLSVSQRHHLIQSLEQWRDQIIALQLNHSQRAVIPCLNDSDEILDILPAVNDGDSQ